MKVNAELFHSAAELRRVGIPVFAAFPRVRSVFEFSEEVEFLWYVICGDENQCDVEIDVDMNIADQCPTSLEGPIRDQDVCRLIVQESRPVLWDRAVESINHVRRQEAERGFWPMGRGYKPVYFLAW
jgi:hypothetical protein